LTPPKSWGHPGSPVGNSTQGRGKALKGCYAKPLHPAFRPGDRSKGWRKEALTRFHVSLGFSDANEETAQKILPLELAPAKDTWKPGSAAAIGPIKPR